MYLVFEVGLSESKVEVEGKAIPQSLLPPFRKEAIDAPPLFGTIEGPANQRWQDNKLESTSTQQGKFTRTTNLKVLLLRVCEVFSRRRVHQGSQQRTTGQRIRGDNQQVTICGKRRASQLNIS